MPLNLFYIFSFPEHAGSVFQVLAFFVVSCVALTLWFLRYRERRELKLLRENIRVYARSGRLPPRTSYASSEVEAIWRIITALGVADRGDRESQEAFEQALLLGKKLAGAADLESCAAAALSEVLFSHASPQAKAIAVLLREEASGEMRLLHSAGVPRERVETSLLMCIEQAGDDPKCWGYRSFQDTHAADFCTFGIELSLFTPFSDAEGVCGGVWIGFEKGAIGLSNERRSFVRAMAEHAAASFGAARKAEQRSRRSEEERDFLLGLSHDLRAPGTRALFALQGMLSEEGAVLSEEQRENLQSIEKAIREQLGLLGDVLQFTSHKRGVLEARRGAVFAPSALSDLLKDYRVQAEAKELELVLEEVPALVLDVDERQLRRMLENLLSNAIKYTDSGAIRVSFHYGGEKFEIKVSDSGVGVLPAERSTLFEPFKRGSNSLRADGLGLGLALTKALAEINIGSLRYMPRPGGGSVFSLEIPLAKGGEFIPLRHVDSRQFVFRSILVVDDDPGACRATVRMLGDLSRVVVPLTSASQLRKALADLKPDVVVSDYYLGDEELSESLADIPPEVLLVVLSGVQSDELRRKMHRRPNTIIFEKPVSRAELRKALLDIVVPELERKRVA